MKIKSKKSSSGFNDPGKGFSDISKRVIVLIIIAILLVIGATYFYVTYRYGSIGNMFLGETTATTAKPTEQSREIKAVTGERNLLIAVTSPSQKSVYNIFLVKCDMNNKNTYVTSIPIYSVDSSGKTLEEQFALGGIAQAKASIEQTLGVNAGRYVCATQNGYKYMLTEFASGVNYNVPEDVQFSTTDFSLSLKAGKQSVSFADLLRLMRYDGWSGGAENTYTMQGNLLCAIYTQVFNEKNVTRDVNRFTELMTYIDSDISSEFFIEDLDAIQYIAASGFKTTVITPSGDFSGYDDKKTFKYSETSANEIKTVFSVN